MEFGKRVLHWRPAQCLVLAAAIVMALAPPVVSASTGNGPSLAQPWVIDVPSRQQEAASGFGAVSSEVAYLGEVSAGAHPLRDLNQTLRAF